MTPALIFALFMSLGHYFSEGAMRLCRRYLGEVASFSAGISVSYVFIQIFPEFAERTYALYHTALFLSVLFGFSAFHIIEKHIYQKAPRNKRLNELALEDAAISFMYHFIVGMLLAELSAKIYSPSAVITTLLIGFVIGTVLFSVIRHSLPTGAQGKPAFFRLGALIYSLVIVMTWGLK